MEEFGKANVNGTVEIEGENNVEKPSVKKAWDETSLVPPSAGGKTRPGAQLQRPPAPHDTRKALVTSLRDFAYDVSVVGLRYVANPSLSSLRRSVWVLLILFGAAFTSYQIVTRIVYYASHPVNVIIRVQHQQEMRFPTVTICNENRASLAKVSVSGEYSMAYTAVCKG